jgi:hypothetical protein
MGDVNNRFALVVKDARSSTVLWKTKAAQCQMRLGFARPKL